MKTSIVETAALQTSHGIGIMRGQLAPSKKGIAQPETPHSRSGIAMPLWAAIVWIAMLAAVLALTQSSGEALSFDAIPVALWSTFTA
jgi:hypothetical protein